MIFMKIPNKRELQQIAFNHSTDIDFQDYESLQKMYCKTMFLFSDWLCFCIRQSFTFKRQYFRENMKLTVIVDDNITD